MTNDQVVAELNSDFGTKGMSATELAAAVKAWQSGAIGQGADARSILPWSKCPGGKDE